MDGKDGRITSRGKDGFVYDGSESGMRLLVDKASRNVRLAPGSTRPPTATNVVLLCDSCVSEANHWKNIRRQIAAKG